MNLTAMSLPPPQVSAEECGNCRRRKAMVLHHVRLRGIHRRLCTCCVLRLHPLSFCPICFAFYDSSPPHTSRRLSCTKCNSYTHTSCSPNSSPPYICPPCKDPSSFSFFDDDSRFIDKKLAEALLCAAKIASASMNKYVGSAKGEADRRVREAALARKRAREALEHVVMLAGKEKLRSVVDVSANDDDVVVVVVKPKDNNVANNGNVVVKNDNDTISLKQEEDEASK